LQLAEKGRLLAESSTRVINLSNQHEALLSELKLKQRYLEELPTSDQHSSNVNTVSFCINTAAM